tara:strand:- start:646 stop:837 length:192 start_codon:yes stop_codon:yes gene_type:complete
VRVEIAAIASNSRFIVEGADHYHEITKEDWFTLPPKSLKKDEMKKQTTIERFLLSHVNSIVFL